MKNTNDPSNVTNNVTNIIRKEESDNHYSSAVLQYRADKFAKNNNYSECAATQGQTLSANITCVSSAGEIIIEQQQKLSLYDSPRANPLRNDKELELGMRWRAKNLAEKTNSTCYISGRQTTFPITFNCSAKISKIQQTSDQIAAARTTLEHIDHSVTSTPSSSSLNTLSTISSIENSISSSDNIIRNITDSLPQSLTRAYNSTFNERSYTGNSTLLNSPNETNIYNTHRQERDVTTVSPPRSENNTYLYAFLGLTVFGLILLGLVIVYWNAKSIKNSLVNTDTESLIERGENNETQVKKRFITDNSNKTKSLSNATLAKTEILEADERQSETPPPLGKLKSLEAVGLIGKLNNRLSRN